MSQVGVRVRRSAAVGLPLQAMLEDRCDIVSQLLSLGDSWLIQINGSIQIPVWLPATPNSLILMVLARTL